MQAAILQGVRDVLFNSRWEVLDVSISEPGIFELADVEAEMRNHRLDASDPEVHIRVSDVHLIVAAIADKEIVNRQVTDTNPSIGRFISVE